MDRIDINCDMGESYGSFTIGRDEELFPWISSCNIACGFHGGDALTIEKTIDSALKYGVRIGAHPSYPDLQGFGRRQMHLSYEELRAIVKYQVAALKAMTESAGGKLIYVKPHGALYNSASTNSDESRSIIDAIRAVDSNLMLMGFAGSIMQEEAIKNNMGFIAEAFADRAYESNGKLRNRSKEGSLIQDPEQAVQQVLSILKEGKITSYDGSSVLITAESICVHGDNDSALAILMAINEMMKKNNISRGK